MSKPPPFLAATAALLLASPAVAGPAASFTTQKVVQRLYGTSCLVVLEVPGKPRNARYCHHVVVTNPRDESANIHFDQKDEQTGISFVVDFSRPVTTTEATAYPISHAYMRTGEQPELLAAKGFCMAKRNGTYGCVADLAGGLTLSGILIP